ncbi:MAG: SDR family NAD(P)-dependent oxidoreductase [Geminicoccaceae bacterium]
MPAPPTTYRRALVTGASSGIGLALAQALLTRGIEVHGTARAATSLAALAQAGGAGHALDLRDDDAIASLITALERRGGIDLLINNAGYGLMAPISDARRAAVHAQFDINVAAPLSLARQLAPHMAQRGYGMIVNISSISGHAPTPFGGVYSASKAALSAASGAMRVELAPFGIRVVTVEPGAIRSHFGDRAREEAAAAVDPNGLYAGLRDAILARARISQTNPTPADQFAQIVVKRLLDRRTPPSRIRAGRYSLTLPLAARLLPDALLDRLLARRFGLHTLVSK